MSTDATNMKVHQLGPSVFLKGGKGSTLGWKSAGASIGRVIECEDLSWGTNGIQTGVCGDTAWCGCKGWRRSLLS